MFILLYGVACYALFVATFLYTIGFVLNFGVPKSIDSGTPGPLGVAVAVNLLLLGLFGLQHSVMARPAFKRWITRFIPAPAERSTFVLATCLVFALLFWQWRPIGGYLWQVEQPLLRGLLTGISLAGFGLVLYASFLINHFDLFGLRQVVLHWKARRYTHTPFATPWLYRIVRNPLMTGFLVAFWVRPDMSLGALLFAAACSGYILVGVWFEERDIARHLGPEYLAYRRRTPAFFPLPAGRRTPAASGPSPAEPA